jgi:F420-non-reducing hydrogenase iron-sulfur subunit
MPLLKRYLEQFGINPKRVRYIFVSASEGVVLTEIAKEFSQEIIELGPNPIRGGN